MSWSHKEMVLPILIVIIVGILAFEVTTESLAL